MSARARHASAKVTFTPPLDPGSSAITGYTVTATDTTASIRGGQQASGPAGPITLGGLTTGDVYTFTVKATNGAGAGFASAQSSAVTTADTETTTGLAGSGSPSATGESVTFTATVAPTPDGGNVAFEADGALLTGCTASAVNAGTGQATCEASSLAAGTHSIVARYGGDAFSAGSESAALAQSVVAADATPGAAPPTAAATALPPDAVIIAGLETVGRATRTNRTLSFTQRVITQARISWRLDLSFYLPTQSDRRTAGRRPIRLAGGGPTAAAPGTLRLGARARAALERHPRARLVLRTTLRLPNGRAIHATKTLARR